MSDIHAPLIGKFVIVRSSPSGCWGGTLEAVDGATVRLGNARRLFRWWAAEGQSLSGVAASGLANRSEVRIAPAVGTVVIDEVCEVLLASERAIASITNAPVTQ